MTTKINITWTERLAAASLTLAREPAPEWCPSIKERGQECVTHARVGQVMDPMQMDVLAMLRSRLSRGYGPPSHTEWLDAFDAAYAAAQEAAS